MSWIMRGDTEGLYDLSADYSSTIDPIGQSLHLVAKTQSPLHVWGASALKTTIVVDQQAVQWAPYAIDIKVKNDSKRTDGVGIPIYNTQIQMQSRPPDFPANYAKYVIAPTRPGDHSAAGQTVQRAVIQPGDTFDAHYIVFPGLGNEQIKNLNLVLQDSYVQQTGGDVDLKPTLVANSGPSAGPNAGMASYGLTDTGDAQVVWTPSSDQPTKTVTGYEFWTRQSLDRGDWYLWKPLPASTTLLKIPPTAGPVGRYYAIGTVFSDGTVEFEHPLVIGPPRYVSLGDSYSAGEGLPAFDTGTAKDVSPDRPTPTTIPVIAPPAPTAVSWQRIPRSPRSWDHPTSRRAPVR